MNYIAVDVTCDAAFRDICIAWLSEEPGYESFEETATGIRAYIRKNLFSRDFVEQALQQLPVEASYNVSEIAQVNWNEAWESNFPFVEVSDDCVICAPFHQLDKSYAYKILIQPQMSFGTGHHSTTRLMAASMLKTNFNEQKVLDLGTGTGVLAILAKKLGAGLIYAVDNDEWSFRNAQENFSLNGIDDIHIALGVLNDVTEENFGVILANINKNVLMAEMELLASRLQKDGILFTSGFYESDVKDLEKQAQKFSLKIVDLKTENNWAMARFVKA